MIPNAVIPTAHLRVRPISTSTDVHPQASAAAASSARWLVSFAGVKARDLDQDRS
jgi:hypothetical protein